MNLLPVKFNKCWMRWVYKSSWIYCICQELFQIVQWLRVSACETKNARFDIWSDIFLLVDFKVFINKIIQNYCSNSAYILLIFFFFLIHQGQSIDISHVFISKSFSASFQNKPHFVNRIKPNKFTYLVWLLFTIIILL